MNIDILSLFPEMFEGPFNHSIIKRAKAKELVDIRLHNIRDFATNKHKQADDYPYGGGAGMVMMPQPVADNIEFLTKDQEYDEIIFTTPDGEPFNQNIANHLSTKKNLMIICGHYKGLDERIREKYITREISIGDYVLSGGELAAAVITDSLVRLLPGVLGDETSALSDSFQDGLLSAPVYTRPYDFRGMKAPDILLSGNEKKIIEWKYQQSVERTKKRRPDLLQEESGEE